MQQPGFWDRPEEGATLIARTAEQAGLTSERMRRAGDRLRGQGPMPMPSRKRRAVRIAAIVGAIALVLAGAWALNRQVFFLGTDEGNTDAHRLYERFGFTNRSGTELMYVYEREL